jgi:hypothetical protein
MTAFGIPSCILRHVALHYLRRTLLESNNSPPAITTILKSSIFFPVQTFISKQEQETITNLCYAAKRGDMLEIHKLLASGINPSCADYDGRTPLVRNSAMSRAAHLVSAGL